MTQEPWPRAGLAGKSQCERSAGAQLGLETAGIHFFTWEIKLILCTSAWGSRAFITGHPAPAGRALEFKASSQAGLWDGANLLSCFSALMCKLIIRHCALIKPKWCNGFAVTEARALPGLGEGRAASAEKQPSPRRARARKCQIWIWKSWKPCPGPGGLEKM